MHRVHLHMRAAHTHTVPVHMRVAQTHTQSPCAHAGHDSSESLRAAGVSASGLDAIASSQGQSNSPLGESKELNQAAKPVHEEVAQAKGAQHSQAALVRRLSRSPLYLRLLPPHSPQRLNACILLYLLKSDYLDSAIV